MLLHMGTGNSATRLLLLVLTVADCCCYWLLLLLAVGFYWLLLTAPAPTLAGPLPPAAAPASITVYLLYTECPGCLAESCVQRPRRCLTANCEFF